MASSSGATAPSNLPGASQLAERSQPRVASYARAAVILACETPAGSEADPCLDAGKLDASIDTKRLESETQTPDPIEEQAKAIAREQVRRLDELALIGLPTRFKGETRRIVAFSLYLAARAQLESPPSSTGGVGSR